MPKYPPPRNAVNDLEAALTVPWVTPAGYDLEVKATSELKKK